MKEESDLRCPECRAPLKKRRTRNPDACEMLCGGCGQLFDVCEPGTLEAIRKESGPAREDSPARS